MRAVGEAKLRQLVVCRSRAQPGDGCGHSSRRIFDDMISTSGIYKGRTDDYRIKYLCYE